MPDGQDPGSGHQEPHRSGAVRPAIVAPWAPGSPTVLVNGVAALTNDSTCVCTLGGTIKITAAGQIVVQAAG